MSATISAPAASPAPAGSVSAAMPAAGIADPRRYFEEVGRERSAVAEAPPVCLYLEVTNRCNLLCETCPRTFEELEPPADMDWALFTRIVDQVPDIARVVLHGVGEPMLVAELPRMIRYLKDRGTYVLFNTNGTLLRPSGFQALIDTGLDELRVSLDAADRASYLRVRGRDFFDRIVRDVGKFVAFQARTGATTPRVSLWLTGMKETVEQLPAFVRLAAEMGVREIHLQRLVFDEAGYGLACAGSSLFESTQAEEQAAIAAARQEGAALGVTLDASGATEPGLSLRRRTAEQPSAGLVSADQTPVDQTPMDQPPMDQPWATCRRPWSLMYFTAHGRALPCCIAPFSARGYGNYTLGDATQQSLRGIWNSDAYRGFRTALLSDAPPAPCRNCGLRWSL